MEIKTKGTINQTVDITSPFSFANQTVENEPELFPYYNNKYNNINYTMNSIY